MSEISILLIGDTRRREFRRAGETLRALGQVTEVRTAPAAVEVLEAGALVPDLLVIAQRFPGEFSCEVVERLRRLSPLARVVGLLGSWCEGEMRSGRPWPAAIRLYWHQWVPQADRQLRKMLDGECSAWDLPMTATEEERLLLDSQCSADRQIADQQGADRRRGLVAVYTWPVEMAELLSAAVCSRGCSAVWLRPPRGARVEGAIAGIFDGSDLRGGELDELRHLRDALAPAPVIALLDLPRIEDHDGALAAGAAAVVSKPLSVKDLFWQLDRLIETPAR
jgi:CheY-like chemotaxis protein